MQQIIYPFNTFLCEGINFPFLEFFTDIQYEKLRYYSHNGLEYR